MTTHPEPELLALAALPAEPVDHGLVGHLATCSPCRRHVETMRTLAELARAAGDGPPPAPPERVWQGIVHELADTMPMGAVPGAGPMGAVPGRGPTGAVPPVGRNGTGPDGPHDLPRTGRTAPGAGPAGPAGLPRPGSGTPAATPLRPRRPADRFRRLAVPLAACLAGIAVGVAGTIGLGGGLGGGGAGPTVAAAPLTPVGPAPAAAGGEVREVAGDGDRTLVVQLRGVTDLAGGDHLEAWLMQPDGSALVPLGSLVPDGAGYRGEFTVPADLPLPRYPVLDVSTERWDGDAGHSGTSLLRARLV